MNIQNRPELGPWMTFDLSKEKPVHGWFWYKEGFAPELVDFAIKETAPRTVLDPFCGVGTSLLACKAAGIESAGVDASELAVFVSRVKTDDYEKADLEAALEFLERRLEPAPEAVWEFELFSARAAFPKRNYGEILALRQAIENEEGRVRNILLLALLSVIPQASLVLKDGGVLKIMKGKRALPAREIFRRKVKRMVRELGSAPQGHAPKVYLGDARSLEIDSGSVDLVVTSPPYLNNIDYSKIYGLELSLLQMSKAAAEEVRMRSVRSFIGKRMEVQQMPPEVGDVGYKIPIIATYFRDMEAAIAEMHRVLAPGGTAHITVSNSVIHQTHVLVDEIFAEMGLRLGFSDAEILVGAERIADVRPQKVRTRESVVVLRKGN
ncbi:MAG: hypothetical protein U0R44_03090 [Candidatus Micrarchaeia archaeon]